MDRPNQTLAMVKNYLKITLRTLRKHKGYAFINVSGLAVGMACCLLILLFVRHELSYDRFHENAERIYRVLREDSTGANLDRGATLIGLLAPRLKETFPGVEQTVRMHAERAVIQQGNTFFEEDNFFWCDSTVFEVFSFALERGDPATALARPNTIVLTPAMAQKYFGDADPMGQTLVLDSRHTLEVTGVAAPLPSTSHLQFDFLASMATLGEMKNPWAGENQGWTYVLLAEGQSAEALEAQINASVGDLVWWFIVENFYVAYRLQPLPDIHLHSREYRGVGEVGDIGSVYLFSMIALLVLLIACINYMNLATARSTHRAREVGMRKTLGAGRRQLVVQFMSESILMSLLALVGAVMLVELTLPFFNDLTGKTLVVDYAHDADMLAFFLGTALVTGLLSGTYPAFFLSRYNPIRVLKGLRDRGGQAALRKGLVVVQVGITVALLIGTVVIYNQMRYIQNKHLGFDTEQVISIRTRGLQTDVETFKQAVLDLPGVTRVSASSGIPINGGWMSNSEINGQKVTTSRFLVDEDYVETMGLEIVVGRDFAAERPTDRTHALLVNETMVTLQGWNDPLEQTLPLGEDSTGAPLEASIIGVVRDFHTGSLHNPILPALLDPRKNSNARTVLVRLRPDDIPGTLAELEATWQRFVPDHPLSYFFVDDVVEALYRADQRFGKTFAAFTLLAILIAGLGLFGLAAFTAEQRTKEIGIRKVLGATVSNITFLLSKDFARLIILAIVLAVPVAYLTMARWLENFAYHIDLSAGTFLLAGALALLAALLAVSYQAVKAALADPVKSLRYE